VARLSDKERDLILADYHTGHFTQRELSKKYSVSTATINKLTKDVLCNSNVEANMTKQASSGNSDGYIYVIYIEDSSLNRFYKIGMARNVEARIRQHQTSSPFKIMIAMSFYDINMKEKEKEIHLLMKDNHVLGEWYKLSEDDLITIKAKVDIYG
jgi:predicted GIY-YIG superfamily endonuclease